MLWFRKRQERELDEEVQSYFQILVERGMAKGLTEQEARRAARIASEGPEQIKEKVREVRTGAALDSLLQDLRYAWRGLARSPGFTFFAVLSISLGLGVNAAIFSVVDGVLLKGSGYPDAERVVQLWAMSPGKSRNTISAADFRDWAGQSEAFEFIAARMHESMSYTGGERPLSLEVALVSPSYFAVFGVKPAMGRMFTESEPRKTVVVSHRLWVRLGAQGAVGRDLMLNGVPHTVVGVLPANSPFDRQTAELWIPIELPQQASRDYNYLSVMAKLNPGVTRERAQANMAAVMTRIAERYPAERKGWGVTVDAYEDGLVGASTKQSLTMLMAAVVAVLLIACANLSNLLLARATVRQREIAMRVALGARRGRIVRMLLTESLLLSAAGAAVGLGVGYGLLEWIQILLPPNYFAAEASIGMDGRVLLFIVLVTVLTSLAIGVIPALQGTRVKGRFAGPGTMWLRSVFVAGQVAAAFVLLMSAGLLIRSFQTALRLDTGFDSTGVVAVNFPLAMDAERLTPYLRQVVDEVRAEPGIVNAAVTSVFPLRGWGIGMRFRMNAANEEYRSTGFKIVTPGYFGTLGLRTLSGRLLNDGDTANAPRAMVVSESFLRKFAPNGRRIIMESLLPDGSGLGPEAAWEIVGVVSDEKANGVELPSTAGVYVNFAQSPLTQGMALLAKGAGDTDALLHGLRRAVDRVNKNQVLDRPMTVEQIKAESMTPRRLPATLMGGFSVVAMLLACAGIYGVLAFVTARRMQEFGVRAALGATRGDLIRTVLRSGTKPVFTGLAVGACGALALGNYLQTMLFGVQPMDLTMLASVSVILLLAALVACFIPAWRAARIDPMSALRQE